MKRYCRSSIGFRLIACVLTLLALHAGIALKAQAPDAEGARQVATSFFGARNPQQVKANTRAGHTLSPIYVSAATVQAPVFVFQNNQSGFVVVSQHGSNFAVVGYSTDGRLDPENMPPQLSALLRYYEDSVVSVSQQPLPAATPVMTPLLNEAGVSLNQFNHENVGGCFTGCVATAFAQIMAYYKYPSRGNGSHCYTDPQYGELCADFGNTNYNWNNPTYADYELLSFHVGIAIDMNYCIDEFGSSPAKLDYERAIGEYFNYYINRGMTESFYILNEINNRRPVYASLPGDPGHAVVIDGYDTDGFFHLNFGWGGSHNGYFALNTNSRINVGYEFGTNVRSVVCMTPTPLKTNEQDSLALVAVHNGLNGTTGWELTKPVFTWTGVLVMNERVIRLRLNNTVYSTYKGVIAPEIGNLTELTELNLLGQFNGELPASIANLSKLKTLSIAAGAGTFKAVLPANIGNLTKLERLSIPNGIEGELPSSIGSLTELRELNLGSGKLTGALPAELGNLTRLEKLYLHRNQLTGTIPVSLGNLLQLTTLELSENQLSGSIPTGIGQLTKLTTLGLSNNKLTGPIPSSIGNLTQLTVLLLNNNALTGAIPAEIGTCVSIKTLGLANNQLEGAVPAGIGMLSAVENLNLSNNKLTALPNEIGRLKKVKELYLFSNQLRSLPDSLSELPLLTNISASNNLIDSLPDNFGNWSQLQSVGLANNKLRIFPEQLCYAPNLEVLDIGNNRLEALPASVTLLSSSIVYFSIDSNFVSGPIPAVLLENPKLTANLWFNRFMFEDIPTPNPKLYNTIGNQRPVTLSKRIINVGMGDTVQLDIRTLAPFTLEGNEYYWYSVNQKKNVSTTSNPILELVIDEKTINNRYYCNITNPTSPEYKYISGSYNVMLPCLSALTTDTLSFRLATDEELLAEKYTDSYVVSSNNLPQKTVENRIVTLVPPLRVRGVVQWQASADGTSWHDLSASMSQNDLKANFISVEQQELVLSPKTPAYYRCSVQDINCEPLYSDTIKVNPFGEVLYDETVNVSGEKMTISVDSLEVTLPKGIHDKEFRLTITKLDNPPAPPDGVKLMSSYDVTVSFAETFDIPLVIKLKNIDKTLFDNRNIHNYRAVYLDERTQQWVNFENSYVSLVDTTMVFETNHLTVIAVGWWDEWAGYDKGYERNNIRVFYKSDREAWMNTTYGKQQTPQYWHVTGIPTLVQDVTEYLEEVRTKFKAANFSVPETFTVYIKDMDDADGVVGVSGMINDYLTINTLTENPLDLRSLLAHEYMHYTQGKHISPDPGNIFWMEANGHLTDRIVWDTSIVPVSESEQYLLKGRTASNSIYNFLADSWDSWDMALATQNLFGNVDYCYLAGTFLHYMRSYSEAESKLDPFKLLKEVATWDGASWRQYLSNYIAFSMNSLIGDEYENYVKFILSGEEPNFTILNTSGNPFSGLIKHSGVENDGVFARRINYSFNSDIVEPQKDTIDATIPYLASHVQLLYNSNPDKAAFVSFKRLDRASGYQHKIYLGRYNSKLKKVEYTDLSDSTSYNFMIEANTPTSKAELQNICFLLLINKNNPTGSAEKDFEALFELTAMPVVDLKYLINAYIAGANGSNLGVHTDNKGEVTNFVIYSYANDPAANISSERTILNDSSYLVTTNYSKTYTLEFDEGTTVYKHTNVSEGTLTIRYNFYAGTLKIVNKSKYTASVTTPTRVNTLNLVSTGEQILQVSKFNNYQIHNKETWFKTKDSSQTQDVVDFMSQKGTATYYNWDTGEPYEPQHSEIVSTQYENGDIILVLIFKNQ